jgi:hypothetical protein
MSDHRSIVQVEWKTFFNIVLTFAGSLGLAVLVLLFFAGGADAACYLKLDLPALSPPVVKHGYDLHWTTYSAGYKKNVFSACGMAFKPYETAVQIKGTWNRITKTATERVAVRVSLPWLQDSPEATYTGITSQKCKRNPWTYYKAGCGSWVWAMAGYGWDVGVTKQEVKKGWNTNEILFAGFDYGGPYPASRPNMGCCWFEPWYGF